MNNKDIAKTATTVVADIKNIIDKGRTAAYATVNTTMIATYWNIGRRIVEEEQHGKERAEYGKNLIDMLATELTHEYGSGFSARYLRAFRQFYLVVPNFEIWKSRFPNLLWTHVFRTLRVGDETAIRWFEAKLLETNAEIGDHFKKYRISDALMAVYKLFWDEFSSWYLEMVKPAYINGEAQPIDKQTYDKTLEFFETLLKMLHPFMPFITEELWQHLYDRKDGESIMRDSLKLPAPTEADNQLATQIENVKQIVSSVRMVRASKNIAPKEQLDLQVVGQNAYEPFNAVIAKMANLNNISVVAEKDATASAFMVGTDEFAVPLGNMIDVEAEIAKMEAQLQHLEGFLAGVMKKLSNERFVANAPEQVVALERKKQSDSEEKIAALKESIAALRGK